MLWSTLGHCAHEADACAYWPRVLSPEPTTREHQGIWHVWAKSPSPGRTFLVVLEIFDWLSNPTWPIQNATSSYPSTQTHSQHEELLRPSRHEGRDTGIIFMPRCGCVRRQAPAKSWQIQFILVYVPKRSDDWSTVNDKFLLMSQIGCQGVKSKSRSLRVQEFKDR